jgi:hypothetical protein
MIADAQGNVTVAGWAYDPHYLKDMAIAQYDRAGRLRWQHQLNGKGDRNDWASDVTVDASGNVTVCGTAYSGSPEMGGTGGDYITLRYDRDGVMRWMRAYDGPVHETHKALHLTQDRAGNIYVTGQSRSQESNDLTTVKYAP